MLESYKRAAAVFYFNDGLTTEDYLIVGLMVLATGVWVLGVLAFSSHRSRFASAMRRVCRLLHLPRSQKATSDSHTARR